MRWFVRLPLAWKTGLVLLVAVLSLLVCWGCSHVTMINTLAALQTQERLITINRSVAEVETNLLEAKVELRSYLLSGEKEYRRRLDRALVRRQDRIKELKILLAQSPEQLLRVQRLDHLMAEWYTEYVLPQVTTYSKDAPLDLMALGVGGDAHLLETQALLREIREVQSAVTTATVAKTRALLERSSRRIVLLTILSTLLMVGLLAQLSRQINRGVRVLQQGAQGVALGRIERIDVHEGAAELGVLAGHFNTMASALLEQKEELQAQHEELIAQNELLIHQQQEMAEIQAEVEAERDQAASLNRLQRLLQEQPSVETLCQTLLDYMLEKGEAQVGAMLLVNEGGGARVVASVALTAAAACLDRLTGFMVEAAKRRELVACSYPEGLLRLPVYTTELPVLHELYLPIADGRSLGVMVLGRIADRPFSVAEQRWLEIFTSTAGASLANRLSFYAAQHQRDLLRHVLDSINEGILLIRSDDSILFNPRYFELIEVPVPLPDVRYAEIEEAVTARVKANPVFMELGAKAKADPLAPLSARLELSGVPGRVLDFYWVSLTDESGVKIGRLNVIRDVSHEATVDRMKGEFLSTVSHELRTPLTSIRGYAELLLEEDLGPVPAEQKECLSVIRENSLHLSGLINDLLEIEKLQQGKIVLHVGPVDLNAVLRRTVRSAEPQARAKGLTLTLEGAPLPLIRGDEGRLVQVMHNLISNALKYTKEGGVRVTAHTAGEWVRIAVADTGIGIPPEGLERLFTRFYRIDNAYTREVGGVGLGLVITKELVERHGGRIEVA
ncbi:MAG TPA: ATP-binding protein, partial [Symbiobacteriaceae bacterium]|nr:ATP-binding protein [Symbiobacteriaceae bacterium]